MADNPDKNIILIGYRSTGKTSVGRRLSERLNLPFYDTDEMVSRRTGKSVKDIVAEKGWEAFRREERIAVKSLSFLSGCVIALGGGAVMDPANVELLKKKGVFVRLNADAAAIVNRMAADPSTGDQRPPLSGGDALTETALHLKEREPIYRLIADFNVDTSGRTINETADEVVRTLSQDLFVGSLTPVERG